MPELFDWITPPWGAPSNVRALITTRNGGISKGPYASMNVGMNVGDDSEAVNHNRTLLRSYLPNEPIWLKQVHGVTVIEADKAGKDNYPEADAAITRKHATVCVIQSADCLPVLLCDEIGTVVGVVHAGWRGLCNGVIENTVQAMRVEPPKLLAYLGPAIGPNAYEVGDEVRQAFIKQNDVAEQGFVSYGKGKWLANLYELAMQRLSALGVKKIYCDYFCTLTDAKNFFSYRREGKTGRIASLIWLS